MGRHIDIKLEPQITELRSVLEEKYPKCFVLAGAKPRPLKLGITDETIKELKGTVAVWLKQHLSLLTS